MQKNKKLKWSNLLEDRCPKCGLKLFTNNYEPNTGINCEAVGLTEPWACDFFITQERFQEIKANMQRQNFTV